VLHEEYKKLSLHDYPTRLLLVGLIIRLILAPLLVQSYDFVHLYYSAFDIAKGTNPYAVYDFAYPPVMLYILSFLAIIYFKANLFLENLDWPSALDWPPSLFKAAFISVPLIGFDVPPPLFNLVFKIPNIIADLAVAILLYKIIYMQKKDVGLAKKSMLLWFLNPLTIWMSSIHGAFDSVAVFFSLLAFYLFIRSSFTLGAFSLGAGVLTKLYPVFIIPVAMSWSLKAKRGYAFTIGLATSLLFLVPLFVVDGKSFYYSLFGTRGSALFLGGLSPWAVKYLYSPMELWLTANSYAIFLTTNFLLGFSILLIFFKTWMNPDQGNISEMNYFVLLSLAAAYIFSPVIIQAQYALWALPFLIISGMTFYDGRSSLYILNIQTTVAKRLRLRLSHKFSYILYLHLFWMSALAFEISLQALSIVIPTVLKTGLFIDFISMTIIYWVVQSAYLRAFIFFLAAVVFTVSYLVPLAKPVRLRPSTN
jgi:hypothetical protein